MTESAPTISARYGGLVAIISLCFAIAFLEGVDVTALSLTASKVVDDLQLDFTQIGLVFAVTNIGLVIGASFGGRLADKIGYKTTLIASVFLFGTLTLAIKFTSDFTSLVVVRLAAGIGFGAVIPTMIAIAAEVSPKRYRAALTTLIFSGTPLGGFCISMYVSAQAGDFDWRNIFMFGGLVALLCAPVAAFILCESKSDDSVKESSSGLLSALFAEGRTATTLMLWLAFFPTFILMHLLLNWLPLLISTSGLSESIASQALAFFSLGGILGAIGLGPAVDRLGFPKILPVSFLMAMVCIFGLANSTSPVFIMGFTGLIGICLFGAQVALYAVAAQFYPAHLRSTGVGMAISIGRLGSILGPLAAGYFIEFGWTPTALLSLIAPAAAVSAVAVVILAVLKPQGSEDTEKAFEQS